jgi:hypothetical protein
MEPAAVFYNNALSIKQKCDNSKIVIINMDTAITKSKEDSQIRLTNLLQFPSHTWSIIDPFP